MTIESYCEAYEMCNEVVFRFGKTGFLAFRENVEEATTITGCSTLQQTVNCTRSAPSASLRAAV